MEKNILDVNLTKHRIEPISSLSAQSIKLCDRIRELKSDNCSLNIKKQSNQNQNATLNLIILLQHQYGLRISEVLNIRMSELKIGRFCIIKGLKGSHDILINDNLIIEIFAYYKSINFEVFEGISRFFVYREFKKLGIQSSGGGNKNLAITHSFRHGLAKDLRNSGYMDQDITLALHHKSKKSQENYGNK
jgi:integrase